MSRIKAQFAGNSWTIAKICNAEAAHFSAESRVHEFSRDSLEGVYINNGTLGPCRVGVEQAPWAGGAV